MRLHQKLVQVIFWPLAVSSSHLRSLLLLETALFVAKYGSGITHMCICRSSEMLCWNVKSTKNKKKSLQIPWLDISKRSKRGRKILPFWQFYSSFPNLLWLELSDFLEAHLEEKWSTVLHSKEVVMQKNNEVSDEVARAVPLGNEDLTEWDFPHSKVTK